MRLALWLLVLTASVARADGDLERGVFAPVPMKAAPQAWGSFLRVIGGGGALAGKTVYVSAGHGWVWDVGLGRWRTQRGNTHDLVEDFISAETISQELVPYLQAMGAYVVPVRESSMQAAMAIADAPAVTGGAPIADGWATPAGPITDGANPFEAGGSFELAAGGTARWDLDVPEDGDYEVYVSWVQGADRASDARYVIHHAGGDTEIVVDQRRHGSTWVLVGQLHFTPGLPASVELAGSASGVVSADAVRIGGGLGHIDRGGGATGRPAFESGARYAAQWNGAPASVWDYSSEDGNDDVGTRSRFSAWDHEAGEDAVYVAWHTNAPSPARGTSSFAYGPDPYGDLSQFTGVAGSLELMDAIHGELVGDLRADWDPTWQDRGQHTAYFGEVNPNHNPEMPATLIEVAFHDTFDDAEALRDPRFRRLAARAFAQGIARYFADRDGVPLTLPPEPPSAPRAIGGVVAWDAPDADPAGGDLATGYRVYLSRDGRAFDAGHDVTETSYALPDGVVLARVTATNAGGESRPSAVVGSSGPGAKVLVVAGFTRLDGTMLLHDDLSAFDLGTIDRAYLDRINDGSHAARHVLAIAGAGYSVDVATAAAVARGEVSLDGYAAVDWAAGEELAPDVAPLAGYAGKVILDGTDVVPEDPAGTYAVAGVAGTAFDGLALTFDDAGSGGYVAEDADVVAGAAVLAYDTGAAAAVLDGSTLTLGFPVETVAGADLRAELMRRALAALDLAPDVPPEDADDAGGCCHASGGDASPWLALVLLCAGHARSKRRRYPG